MQEHKNYLEDIEEKILKEELLPSDLIDFYKAIFDYHADYYQIYKETLFVPTFIKSEGMPLIDVGSILFPSEISARLNEGLSSLISIIEKHQAIKLDILGNAIGAKDNLLEGLFKALLKMEHTKLQILAGEINIDLNIIIFILTNLFKPLFIYLMEQNCDKIENEEWFSNNCPFCGYYPDMAKIVESAEGKRYLHCSLCECEWNFKRISCAICENDDFEMLEYFVTDEESLYRIDYCKRCNGYIKTIRIPKFKEDSRFDLTVENIATAYLDSLALKRGYLRP